MGEESVKEERRRKEGEEEDEEIFSVSYLCEWLGWWRTAAHILGTPAACRRPRQHC